MHRRCYLIILIVLAPAAGWRLLNCRNRINRADVTSPMQLYSRRSTIFIPSRNFGINQHSWKLSCTPCVGLLFPAITVKNLRTDQNLKSWMMSRDHIVLASKPKNGGLEGPNPHVLSDIPVTETQIDTEKIDISKTHTETNTEKIFNTDTCIHIEMITYKTN